MLRWIASRGVALQSLCVGNSTISSLNQAAGSSQVVFPAVSSVSWADFDCDCLRSLLQTCPNITSITCDDYLNSVFSVSLLKPFPWKIKHLTVRNQIGSLRALLRVLGPTMEELRFHKCLYKSALTAIAELCPSLRLLEVNVAIDESCSSAIGSDAFFPLLSSLNMNYEELVVHNFDACPRPFTSLAEWKVPKDSKLRRLSIPEWRQTVNPIHTFRMLMDKLPFQYVNLGNLEYDRARKMLKVTAVVGEEMQVLFGLLGCCSNIAHLRLTATYPAQLNRNDHFAFFVGLGTRLGSSLTVLDVDIEAPKHVYDFPVQCLLREHCPNLTDLTIHSRGEHHGLLTNFTMMDISKCKLLRHLHVTSESTSDISDMGLISVFEGCPLLKDVMIRNARLTFATLQNVVDYRVRLSKIHFGPLAEGGIDCHYRSEWFLEHFRQEVKRKNMLPGPVVVIEQ